MERNKTMRTCPKGHTYYKSSDCPVCPVCEKEKAQAQGFLATLSAPARRALEREGITDLHTLSAYSERKILELHGVGPTTIPKLKSALAAAALSFKDEQSR